MSEVLIPVVNSLIILDSDGNRLFVKYYDKRGKSQQVDYEKLLHKKTKAINAKADAEVLIVENEVVTFKSGADVRLYVSGNIDENELILTSVLETVFEAVNTLLKGQVDKRTMLDNLELILLTIDETLDEGNLMELDASAIVSRVLMRGPDSNYSMSSPNASAQPATSMGDITLSQALGMAKDSIFKSFLGV
eukprot:gene10959-12184_t